MRLKLSTVGVVVIAVADMLFCSLSFYKEELAGENKNYVHLRADAEQISSASVLRRLIEEVLDSARKMDVLTAADLELGALWQRYMQVRAFLLSDVVACS